MSEHKDDIEKYLDGTLNHAERHRLEKKALSDPFLAEALEGAEGLTPSEFSHDLNEIHQRINTQKRNTFFWPLRIAAGIFVIISITIITIQLTENDTHNQLALQKQNPPHKDLATPNKVPAPANQNALPNAEQQTPASESRRTLPNEAISEKPQASPGEPVSNTDALSPISDQAEQELKESESTKENIDEQTIEQKTELPKVLESEDKKTETAPSKTDRGVDTPPATRSLSLNKKSEAASGAAMAKDDAQPAPAISEFSISPLPAGGMSQFNKYVEDHLRYPQRALSNNIQGDVIIEFRINDNGSYDGFNVVKSLGFGCDDEAIRLIKEGPKWNPVDQNEKVINNKPRVTIPFRIKKTGN